MCIDFGSKRAGSAGGSSQKGRVGLPFFHFDVEEVVAESSTPFGRGPPGCGVAANELGAEGVFLYFLRHHTPVPELRHPIPQEN